jgi:hypothetical protein
MSTGNVYKQAIKRVFAEKYHDERTAVYWPFSNYPLPDITCTKAPSRTFWIQRYASFGSIRGINAGCLWVAAATAERFGQCSLDQPGDFIFALSSKRIISFDDRTATSELAFVCNQENKHVAVLLIPLDGTFTSRHNATPVTIQKIEDQTGPSDLMQRWENGPDCILLESPDEQRNLPRT